MSGEIVNLNQSVHQVAQELLPWFATGKLSEDEAATVRAHLQTCAQCQSDLEWEYRMLAAEPECSGRFDMESALSRLKTDAKTSLGARLRNGLSSLLRRPERATSWMQWLLAAQSVAIVLLATVLVFPRQAQDPYRTLGTPSALPQAGANLVVVFEPDTSERDLRRILQSSGARIVDGPTVTDAYILSVTPGQLESSIRALKTEKSVRLAESLAPGGAR